MNVKVRLLHLIASDIFQLPTSSYSDNTRVDVGKWKLSFLYIEHSYKYTDIHLHVIFEIETKVERNIKSIKN